jgi:hypothetical protein
MRVEKPGSILRSLSPLPSAGSNSTFMVEAWAGEGSGQAFGLTFNWVNEKNFYTFVIQPSAQSFSLWEFKNGWTLLQHGTSTAIRTEKAVNRLKVIQGEGQISAYVNGQKVAGGKGSLPAGGKTGLEIWSMGSAPVVAHFDNFRVYNQIFLDDFSQLTGWELLPAGKIEHRLVGGNYVLQVNNVDTSARSLAPLETTGSRFTFSVEARSPSGAGMSYGLTFDWQDSKNFYTLIINPQTSSFTLWKFANGWQKLVEGQSPAIQPAAQTNLLQVKRLDWEIQVLCNGTVLKTLTEGAFMGGRVGLEVWSGSQVPLEVQFDNFELK